MYSLQVQIRSLNSSKFLISQQQKVTIRFGPLQTDIFINEENQSGGKRILIDMTENQMNNLLKLYAFGMFMQNQYGRFWCILNLQNVTIGEQFNTNGLVFYNDQRKVCYEFSIIIKLREFNPKMPNNRLSATTNQQMTVNNQNLMQTMPVSSDNKIKSFLNGKRNEPQQMAPKPQAPKRPFSGTKKPSATGTRKPMKPSEPQGKKQPQTQIEYGVKSVGAPQWPNSEQSGIYIPPVMQFTNTESTPSVPKLQQNYLDNGNYQYEHTPNVYTNGNKFVNKVPMETVPRMPIFQNISEFRENGIKQQSQQKQKINRQELRARAKMQAELQWQKKGTQIMVPMPNSKNGTYELVPLSALSEQQILEYAEKQKKAQQFQILQKQLREKERLKEQRKKKRLEQIGKASQNVTTAIKNQNIGIPKQAIKDRISEKNSEYSSGESISELEEVSQIQEIQQNMKKQTSQQQSVDESESYSEDFESLSNANSLLKSRRSSHHSSMSNSRRKEKATESDISQSIDDYGYSNDFDSYSVSQSAYGKSKKHISGSEISDSFSVSYKR